MTEECEKCKDKAAGAAPVVNPPKFRINRDGFGGIEVEAPNKEDCIDLFKQVTAQPTKGKIEEAIR